MRHGRSMIFISADCTPGGKARCVLPESVVGALEKQMNAEAQPKYPIGYMSTYAACAIAICDRYDDMCQSRPCEHASRTSRTDLETAIDAVGAAIMLHKQSLSSELPPIKAVKRSALSSPQI